MTNDKQQTIADRYRAVVLIAPAPIVSRDVIGNTHSCVFSAHEA